MLLLEPIIGNYCFSRHPQVSRAKSFVLSWLSQVSRAKSFVFN